MSVAQTITEELKGTQFGMIKHFGRIASWHTIAPPVVFFAMLIIVSIFNPNYLGPLGISIATASAAPILLIALGQSMVLNVGSIDLSNAAISLFGAILLALSVPDFGWVSIIVILALLTFLGAINGAILAYTQIPSFALTLGTLGILKTATLVISGSETIYVTNNRELITLLYSTKLGGISLTFWLGISVALILWAVLRLTMIGQDMTGIGKNEKGAILTGVPVKRVKIMAFALSGFAAGLAGFCIVAQAGSASASGLGSNLLLPGIAAALVGGTSISGGVTNPINVIFGALTVAFVPIAIQAIGFGAQAQSLVYGFFIILVVALSTIGSKALIVK
jgi:ribose transport system permease protein